jgi:2Fe-2S ferredoxin
MARIKVVNLLSKAIESTDKTKKLLQILLEHTDWMHACGGKGRCTSCKAIVVQGEENLGPITEAEKRFRRLHKLQDEERLTCQVCVSGDIIIRVADQNKLPHLQYLD